MIDFNNQHEVQSYINYLESQIRELKQDNGLFIGDSNKENNNTYYLENDISKNIIHNNVDKNLLIEGENLHTLKLLEETYLNKIDLIYIDPPYNTGNKDFIYKDNWSQHSHWLSFMDYRLSTAKGLLSDRGLIFISIDDKELAHLKILCDRIFGEKNKIAIITWQHFHTVKNNAKHFSRNTEYILVYAKNSSQKGLIKNEIYDKSENYPYDDNDGKGKYNLGPIYAKSKWSSYSYTFKDGRVWTPPEGTYPRFTKEKLKEMEENNEVIWKPNAKNPMAKYYLKNVQVGKKVSTFWSGQEVGYSMTGVNELKNIIGNKFENPKPTELIKRIIRIATNKDSIILDFFAGSGTTGQAVLEVNQEDRGSRQFILVTNNQNNICEAITYQRLSKVINGYTNIKNKHIEGLPSNLYYYILKEQ